jgi:hypothetical protein
MNDLYESIVELTKDIALQQGIAWTEEQAEIAYEVLQTLKQADAVS